MRLNASGPVLKAWVIVALALGGCSANNNSIYRLRKVSDTDPTIVTVDAKQRHLIANPAASGANNTGAHGPQFCTEPPPDVFSVYAQAVGANAALSKSGNPTALDASLGFSYSGSEQGATIARALALNMFNYRNYSTCLKAMNGMIGNLEMPIVEARDQRSAVSWMAIDGLTAAVTPKPTIIGASGSASSGTSSDSVALIARAGTAMDDAKLAEKAANKAWTDLDASLKCEALIAKTGDLTPEETTNKGKCVATKTAKSDAHDDAVAKEERYNTLRQAMEKGSPATAAATVSTPQEDKGGVGGTPRNTDVSGVAAAVQAIVQMAYKQDETELFCIRMLGADPKGPTQADRVAAVGGDAVFENCIKYLLIKTEAESARNLQMLSGEDQDRILREFNETRSAMSLYDAPLFEKFWARVAASPGALTADPAKLSAIITAKLGQNGNADIPSVAQRLRNMLPAERSAAFKAFQRLDNATKIELAEGR